MPSVWLVNAGEMQLPAKHLDGLFDVLQTPASHVGFYFFECNFLGDRKPELMKIAIKNRKKCPSLWKLSTGNQAQNRLILQDTKSWCAPAKESNNKRWAADHGLGPPGALTQQVPSLARQPVQRGRPGAVVALGAAPPRPGVLATGNRREGPCLSHCCGGDRDQGTQGVCRYAFLPAPDRLYV